MRFIYVLGVGAILAGCVTTDTNKSRHLSADDITQERYQFVETHLYTNFPTIQRQLFVHQEYCQVEVKMQQVPKQVHYSTIYYGPAGATEPAEQVIYELTAYSSGKVGLKGYSYYSHNKQLTRDVVNVILNPTDCPAGIEPNPHPDPQRTMKPAKIK